MASPHVNVKKHNGFMLIELLMGIFILMILIGMIVPNLVWHRDYYAVDALTREMVMDLQWIRQHSFGNGLGGMDDWCLSVRDADYRLVQNNYLIRKRRNFGKSVHIPIEESRKDFRFDGQGKPKGKNMQLVIRSRDGKYERRVVIAAQTGRIRVE